MHRLDTLKSFQPNLGFQLGTVLTSFFGHADRSFFWGLFLTIPPVHFFGGHFTPETRARAALADVASISRAFLRNHTRQLIAVDFFTVPTVTFRVLFVFVVLAHERRRVLHFAVTEVPSAAWAGQQIVNAFPFETSPKYLLRDRDGIYGAEFTKRVTGLGIEEKPAAPHAPWQNPYVERLIGTICRECLDQVIVIGERHLHSVLKDYFDYYHLTRPHRSLVQDSPVPRPVMTLEQGPVIEFPQVGGLHHLYTRQAA